MARFARKKKSAAKDRAEGIEQSTPPLTEPDVKKELDDLLDLVDEVLELNAETFVKAYVQRGGQ